jgi:hypothetical protein
MAPQDRVTNLLESEEVVVADPRGSLTPGQMVDQKLLALLGSCPRSLEPGNRQTEDARRSWGVLPVRAGRT